MAEDDAAATVALLEQTWAAIAATVADIDEAGFNTWTDCPGWTVKDVLSHVIGSERAMRGELPPDVEISGDHIRNELGRANERWVAARRQLPGAAVLAEFRTIASERPRELRQLDSEQLDRVVPTLLGEMPVRDFLEIRLFDCFSHEQDIRRAVMRPGRLDGDETGRALALISRSLGAIVARRGRAPEGSRVTLTLPGPLMRSWTVVVDNGRGVVTEGEQAPTVRLEADVETLLCLAWGRWRGQDAEDRGRLRLSGDIDLGRRVAGALSITP